MSQIDNIDAIETETIVEQIEADGQIVLPGMPEPIEAPAPTESPELTIDEIIAHVFKALGWSESTETTLYQIYKVINGVLAIIGAQKDGKDYRVTSQMMYQYGRNKMIIKGRSITGHELITMAEVTPFVKRFTSKFVR